MQYNKYIFFSLFLLLCYVVRIFAHAWAWSWEDDAEEASDAAEAVCGLVFDLDLVHTADTSSALLCFLHDRNDLTDVHHLHGMLYLFPAGRL